MLPPMLNNSRMHDASCPVEADELPVRCTQRRQKSRGQSLVEFAILLPMLVFILVVAADFGRAFTAYIAISSAAREGAAYGMQSMETAGDTDKVRAAALADAPTIWGTAPTVPAPVISPDGIISSDGQSYNMVTVTVNYTFSPLFPLPSIPPFPAIPDSVVMSRSVSMRILN